MLSTELFDTLDLHNDSIIHDEIHAKSFFEHHPAILEPNDFLSFNTKPLLLQCSRKDRLVDRLHKTGPQVTMHLKGGVNDRSSYVIQVSHRCDPPRLRGSA